MLVCLAVDVKHVHRAPTDMLGSIHTCGQRNKEHVCKHIRRACAGRLAYTDAKQIRARTVAVKVPGASDDGAAGTMRPNCASGALEAESCVSTNSVPCISFEKPYLLTVAFLLQALRGD